jgi:hypothetical protein
MYAMSKKRKPGAPKLGGLVAVDVVASAKAAGRMLNAAAITWAM